MNYVGLDVGDNGSSIEILDQHGKHFKHLEVKGRWPAVLERMRQEVPRPFSVCFEASNGYGYLHEQLSTMARRVSVAHPGQLRLIFRAKRKHNRVDAVKLAKLQYLDEVPEVHVPGVRVREWRATIEYRQRLLHQRVRSKNQIRALLKSQGIQIPSAIRSLWTRKGTAWLKSLQLHESQALRRDIMLDELHSTNDRIHLVERYLRKVADGHPGVTLLRTIPGVGVRTAEAVCAYVDDIKRFGRIRQLSAYFGMIPCQDASGNVNRLGHITKDGPPTVRKMLIEAAWQGVRRSAVIRAFFERIKQNDPQRRKIALVATAHHLLRVMGAMLRSGEVWRHETKKGQARPTPSTMTTPPTMRTTRKRTNRRITRKIRRPRCASPLRKTPDT